MANQKRPKFYSFNEIGQMFPSLLKEWDKKKINHKNPKEIESIIRKLKSLLKRKLLKSELDILQTNMDANMYYLQLKQFISQPEIDYDSIILNTPVSDLIKVFISYSDSFDDKTYWENLRHAYVLQNYKKISYKVLKTIFSATRDSKEFLMDQVEQKLVQNLPETITIYRGGSITELKSKKYGISWSLNKEIANQFAEVKKIRDKKEMVIIEKQIKKTQIIAYFKDRNEEEIIFID